MAHAYNLCLDDQAADKGKGRAILGLSDNTSLVQGYTAIAGPPHETDPLKDAQAQIAVLCSQLQCQKVVSTPP